MNRPTRTATTTAAAATQSTSRVAKLRQSVVGRLRLQGWIYSSDNGH